MSSIAVDDALLASGRFAELTADLDALPRASSGPTRTPPSTSRWRLACPSTQYALHVSRRPGRRSPPPNPVRCARRRAPEAAPPRTAAGRRPRGVGAACRFHRVPYAVYAGFSNRVRGARHPTAARLQPSPLHLILRSLRPPIDQARSRSTRSSSSTWTRTDGHDRRHVHPRPRRSPRSPAAPRSATPHSRVRSLDFLGPGARGTFFVVGEIAGGAPDLVREVAARGHEIGLHGWRHAPLTELDARAVRAPTSRRGKALLEELHRRSPCVGFRAPTFSLGARVAWAVDVLADAGFTVLVERAARPAARCSADPTRPPPRSGGRTAWSSCRARWCGSARRRTPLPRRRLPPRASRAAASATARRGAWAATSCSGSTATPTTSTPARSSGWCPMPVGSAAVSSGTTGAARSPRSTAMLRRPRRSTPPAERLDEVHRTRMSDSDFSQLEMVHRLPPASLVDRFDYLRDLGVGPPRRPRGLRRRRVPDAQRAVRRVAARAPRRRRGGARRPRPRRGRRRRAPGPGIRGVRRRLSRRRSRPCARARTCRRGRRRRGDRAPRRPGAFLDGVHRCVAPWAARRHHARTARARERAAALRQLRGEPPRPRPSYTCHTLDTMLRRHRWEPVGSTRRSSTR